ncbi:MAG: Gfo/Idh/MocA family protein [Promethearchaeota archaeon]
MDYVNFGIVGCGMAGSFHILGVKKRLDMKIRYIAACDVNKRNLKRFTRRNKVKAYSNIQDFLKDDEIEAVLLAVPHYLHAPLTKKVAEAGKHVLCEKPMAPTLEECDVMINATKEAGVKFMIAENHRFLPAHQYIKDCLERNIIGDIYLGRTYEGAFCETSQFLDPSTWNFRYDQGGGGVVADQGVHKFSILNWFLGEVDSAQCWCGKALPSPDVKGEDNAIVLLRYKNGAMVDVVVSSITIHPLNNNTELHGTNGTILEDHSWDNPVKIFSAHESAEKKGEYYTPSTPIEHGPYPKYYTISARYEDSHFADCILNNKDPDFSPEQAKEAVAVVLLAYLSTKNGRMTSMDELKEIYENLGTKSILQGLNKVVQKNYRSIQWK